MNEVFIVLLGVLVGAGLEWLREWKQSLADAKQELERWARDNQREVIWRAQETLLTAQQFIASPYDTRWETIEGFISPIKAQDFARDRGYTVVAALDSYVSRLEDGELADLLTRYTTYFTKFVNEKGLEEGESEKAFKIPKQFNQRVAILLKTGSFGPFTSGGGFP